MVQGPAQGQPELMARRLPDRMRKKLRVMLLFKQSQGGSPIFEVQEDYKRCYGQEIIPEAYGFMSWVDMFESMDEFEVKAVKREKKIVRAKPLTHELTAAYLREIFPQERPVLDNVQIREGIEIVNGAVENGERNEVAGVGEQAVGGNTNVGSSSPDTTSQPLDLTVAEADNAAIGSGMNNDANMPSGGGQSMQTAGRTSSSVDGGSTGRRTDGNENDDDDVILVCEKKAKQRGREKSGDVKPSVADLVNSLVVSEATNTVASEQLHDVKPPAVLLFSQTEVPSTAVRGTCCPGTSRSAASDSISEQIEEDIKPKVDQIEVPSDDVKPVVKQEVKNEIKEEVKQEVKVECKEEIKDEPKDEAESDPLAGSDSGSDNFQLDGDEEEILRYLDSPTPPDAADEAEAEDVLPQVEAVPASKNVTLSPAGPNCEMLANGPCHVNTILSKPISDDSDGGESEGSRKAGSPEHVAAVSEFSVQQEFHSNEETAVVSPTPLVSEMADATPDIPEPMDTGSQEESVAKSASTASEKFPSQAASGGQQKNKKSTAPGPSTRKHSVEQKAARASTQAGKASTPVCASGRMTRQNSTSSAKSSQPADVECVQTSAESSVLRGQSKSSNEKKTPQKRRSPEVVPGTSGGTSTKRSKVVAPPKDLGPLTSVENKLERFSSFEGDSIVYRHRLFIITEERPRSSVSFTKRLRSKASEFYYGSKGTKNILDELSDIRENYQSEPGLMRFHPFYRPGSGQQRLEGSQISTSFGSSYSKEVDQIILSMSPESVQLLNLDAELNFELCGHLIGDKVTYISSYGHFEDYFVMRYGEKAKGACYVPLECFEMSEFMRVKKEPGIFPFFGESPVNIFDPSSKADFEEFVDSNMTDPVDIFVANGIGYPELQCRPQDLCLAQLVMAVKIVRVGGMFVIKLEDTISDLGVCFIRLLSLCFGDIQIHKPVSAMPGERFVVCRRKKSAAEAKPFLDFTRTCYEFIVGQLFDGNEREIKQFYAMESIQDSFSNNDEAFLLYVRNQNKLIGDSEIDEWLSYIEYSKGIGVKTVEDRLKDCAKARVTYWNKWNQLHPLDSIIDSMVMRNSVVFDEDSQEIAEDNISDNIADVTVDADESASNYDAAGAETSQEPSDSPVEFWKQLVNSTDSTVILEREKSVVSIVRRYTKPQGYSDQWMCLMSTGAKNRFVILACSNGVYKFRNKTWEIINGLQLPQSTIIYGELFRSSKGQTLNIIDAAMLGADDIRLKNFDQRRRLCKDFASTVDAPFNENWRVIVIDAVPLENLSTELKALCANKNKYSVQNSQNQFCASLETEGSQNLVEFDPKEVLLLKTKLVTNVGGDVGTNGDETVDFKFVMRNRLFWEWNPRSKLEITANEIAEELICKDCSSIFSYMETNAKN